MTTKKPDPAHLQLLFEALQTPHGRKVTTNNPSALRQRLYAIRKTDSVFDPLSFVISPNDPEKELWIVNRSEETANASA